MFDDAARKKALQRINDEIERDRAALEGMSPAESRAMWIMVAAVALIAVVLFWIIVK